MLSLKKMVCVSGFLSFAWWMVGCGPAEFLQPLFHESDGAVLVGLEGTWLRKDAEEPKEEFLLFERQDKNRYLFHLGEEKYEGFLGQIGSDYYFEIVPDRGIRNDGRFKMVLAPEGQKADLSTSVIRIADGLCLTLEQVQPALAYPQEIEFQVLPTRHILKLKLDGDLLEIGYCDKDKLFKMLEKGQVLLSYSPKQELITATTEELQSFLAVYDRSPQSGLFAEMGTYRRVSREEENKE